MIIPFRLGLPSGAITLKGPRRPRSYSKARVGLRQAFGRRPGALAMPRDEGTRAFEWGFGEEKTQEAEALLVGDAALVTLVGPIEHHAGWFFASYEELLEDMAVAFGSSARQVVLAIDSPGGEVSGLFATSRELRRMADAAGKPFVAWVDGQMTSAALSLGVAADRIIAPAEAVIGSVGIILESWYEGAAAESAGYQCRLFVSGPRKTDGHPMVPPTDEADAALQKRVDEEAEIFFQWVGERRGMKPGAVAALDAGVFHTSEAIQVGLADELGTFSGALGMGSGAAKGRAPTGAKTEGRTMKHASIAALIAAVSVASEDLEAVRKRLGKMAAEDSDEGRQARKALKALDSPDEEKEKDGDDDKEKDKEKDSEGSAESDSDDDAEDESEGDDAEDESDDARAEDDSDDADAEDDSDGDDAEETEGKRRASSEGKPKGKPKARRSRAEASLVARALAMATEAVRETRKLKRAAIIARFHLTRSERLAIAFVPTNKLVQTCKAIVALPGRARLATGKPGAQPARAPTQGQLPEGKPGRESEKLSQEEEDRLDREFGLKKRAIAPVENIGNRQLFRAVTPTEAREAAAGGKA